MRISLSRMLSLLPLLAVPLAACSDPPIDPVDLADRAALHAREMVHQSGGGVGFTQDDNSGLQKIVTGMSHAGDGVSGVMPAAMPPGMMSAMGTSPIGMAMAGLTSVRTTEEQFDDTADDLKVWLRQRILADANLETRSHDEAIYLLRPEITCQALPTPDDPPGYVLPLNQKCVDQLTRLEVRVSLRADGDGARLTILIGPDRLELSAFVIHSDLLAVEVDLPKAYQATQYIDQTLGTDSPSNARFDALAGRVRLSLHKDGEKKVTGAISVLQAIHVATLSQDGSLGPEVSVGASDPTLSVTADGIAQALTVAVNVAAVDVRADWDPGSTLPPNRDANVAVGGLFGSTTFTEADDQIVAKGLGIGDVAVDLRDARVFDLGFNPADMHRFDLRISLDAAEQPQFEVTPRFDLSLGFHLGLVASQLTNPPPSYALDESYGIKLDNGGQPAGIAAAPANTAVGFNGGLKVTAGTLTLSSTSVADPVVVPAGKCLTGLPSAPAGAHPLLGALTVVDCP